MRSRRADEAGAVAVFTAILALLLFAVAALVVDLGMARDLRRQSQIAADASALAAANVLYDDAGLVDFDAAVSAAESYAAANFAVSAADWAACADSGALGYAPAPQNPCVSFDNAVRPSRVRVRIPDHTMRTGFARVIGVDEITVATSAGAAVDQRLPCALCVLGTGLHSLGNGDVTADASIHFNGSLAVGPQGVLSATGAGSTISVELAAEGSNYYPAAQTNVGPLADPLADMRLPDATGLQPRSDPCADGPGIYGAEQIPNKQTCRLSPGTYYITGDWSLKNKSALVGDGVTLFFASGELDAKNGLVDISAPTTGPFKGLALAYARSNSGELSLQGNGDSTVTGTIYAPVSTFSIIGNSEATAFAAAVVVGNLHLNGNKTGLGMTYDAAANWSLPRLLGLDQ